MKKLRINRDITCQNIRLVFEDKTSKVLSLSEALQLAQEQGKDLVEIFPDAELPVCKIIHYEKYLYQLQKEDKENKKKSKTYTMKEMQFGLTIGDGDYKTKVEKVSHFIDEGHKVQFSIILKKKQMDLWDTAEKLLNKIIATLGDKVKIEKAPFQEKKKVLAIIAPQGKKKNKTNENNNINTKINEN